MSKYQLTFCLLFCFNLLQAQQPASIQLTEKDGLPDIDFYNIIEDSKQFIWLAADKGLYRYDGQNYDYYSHPKQRGNAVFGTLEDTKGRVWCNNISGQFFYTNEKKLELFIDFGKILNGELSEFKITPTHLIVFTGRNIYKVGLQDKKIDKAFNAEFSLVGSPAQIGNNYYYTKRNEIIKTDSYLIKKDSLLIDAYEDNYEDSSVSRRINLASNGTLFLCYYLKFNANVFYHIDMDKKRYDTLVVPKQLQPRIINQIFFKNDTIWMATDQGIMIFSLKGNELQLQSQLFNKINVTKIIIDSDDNYWFTTINEGVFVVPNINVFEYGLKNNLQNINKLKKINTTSVLLGTNNGKVASLDISTKQLKLIDSSSVFRVTDILLNLNKTKAIITKEDKAFSYNIPEKTISTLRKPYLYGAKSLSMIDSTNYILSSYKDAFLLDTNFEAQEKLVNKRSYTNHYSQATQTIYIGAVEGLFLFDKDLNKSEILNKGEPILAVSISETKDEIIWVATFKNGVIGIKNGTIVSHYNTDSGLLSNKIITLKADGNGLWIATEKGIQFLEPLQKTFKNLTKQNGIPSYRISAIEVMDNSVLFASNIGLFGVFKDKVFKTINKKQIYFTDILINDISKPLNSLYELNYDENDIAFNFNVNGFQSNINTLYEYRLLGADTTWKRTNELVNSVSYNSLPNGEYTFQVKVLPERDTIKSVQFSILKPFWKRWWFYILGVVLVGFIIYSIFVSKIRKLKTKQTEILQKELLNRQLVFSQLENLRSQMNPHFIFNALNSIQEYIVLNEKDLASSYLIKFSRLIRIYLEHSRENEVLLSEEIKALQIYLELEKNRFEDLLDYTISIDEEVKSNTIKIPSLFIQPYIENALKHGLLHKKKDRKLNVSFNLNTSKDIVICKIEDNGIGIEASKRINSYRQPQHKSFATTANEKRVNLLNTNRVYKITVETINLGTIDTTGTLVVITIPFQKT